MLTMARLRFRQNLLRLLMAGGILLMISWTDNRWRILERNEPPSDISLHQPRVATPSYEDLPITCPSTLASLEPLDKEEKFCGSVNLGCMKITGMKGTAIVKEEKDCIGMCAAKNQKYSGFHRQTGECKCAASAALIGDVRSLVDRSDEHSWCQRDDVVSGNFLNGICQTVSNEFHQSKENEPFSQQYVASRSKGCFKFPTNAASFDCVRMTSPAHCLLRCERERHPLAAVGSDGQCMCGRMTGSFNLTHQVSSCNSSDVVEVFRTLVEDQRCGNIRFLPPGKYNRTSLNSTPGSGNTWTRYLLEKATGHYTGSMYTDGSLVLTGYLGESFSSKDHITGIIKDHIFGKSLKIQQESAITIVRNPYRSLISQRNWEMGNHHGLASEARMSTAFPPKYADNNLRYWQGMMKKTINSGKPYLIMFYEDIVADPISSVRKMVKFLPNPALHPSNLEERLACLSQETTGLAKRKSRKLSFNPWPPESIEIVNRFVLESRQILLDTGMKNVLPSYELDVDYAM
uniref:Sulfotransferase n=1 Tax=Phallusia mammillata TaxID=59560 RepID=A0A6F9DXN5_9ASCI|nr:WSC domain-containing protein 1-like [Phallusia mammillata]